MLDWWEARSIGYKRSIGLMFDLFCIFCLSFLPFLYHGFWSWSKLAGLGGGHIPPEFTTAMLLLTLLNSPLPIMSLRFFCKFVIHSQTPGEMLCGYTPICTKRGPAALGSHMGYALVLWLSTTVASTVAGLIFGLGLMPIMPLLKESSLVTPFVIVLSLAVYLYVYVLVQARFFKPKFTDRLESGMDKLCSMQVVPRGGRLSALPPVTLQSMVELPGAADVAEPELSSDKRQGE